MTSECADTYTKADWDLYRRAGSGGSQEPQSKQRDERSDRRDDDRADRSERVRHTLDHLSGTRQVPDE